jgi:hypothetical protein
MAGRKRFGRRTTLSNSLIAPDRPVALRFEVASCLDTNNQVPLRGRGPGTVFPGTVTPDRHHSRRVDRA